MATYSSLFNPDEAKLTQTSAAAGKPSYGGIPAYNTDGLQMQM